MVWRLIGCFLSASINYGNNDRFCLYSLRGCSPAAKDARILECFFSWWLFVVAEGHNAVMDDRSWILPIVVLSLWRGFAFGEKPLPKPKNFKVLLSTSSSLTVAWDMVPHDGFRETGYFQMRLKSLFGSFNVVDGGVPSSARAFTFPDLLPNTRYELKVTARWENNRTSATTYGMTGQDLTPRPPTQTYVTGFYVVFVANLGVGS
jgi:hypothetical protein